MFSWFSYHLNWPSEELSNYSLLWNYIKYSKWEVKLWGSCWLESVLVISDCIIFAVEAAVTSAVNFLITQGQTRQHLNQLADKFCYRWRIFAIEAEATELTLTLTSVLSFLIPRGQATAALETFARQSFSHSVYIIFAVPAAVI